MRRVRLSSLAEADIAGILRWTEDEFGASARLRYEALIAAALRDLAEDPYRPGARERPEIGEGLMSYHLHFSRRHVAAATGRVRRPRHLLLYRAHGDSLLPPAACCTMRWSWRGICRKARARTSNKRARGS